MWIVNRISELLVLCYIKFIGLSCTLSGFFFFFWSVFKLVKLCPGYGFTELYDNPNIDICHSTVSQTHICLI